MLQPMRNTDAHGVEPFPESPDHRAQCVRLRVQLAPNALEPIHRIIVCVTAGSPGTWATFGFVGPQSAEYTKNRRSVEDRTLLPSESATTLNNNNVLAALIDDLTAAGILS